MVTSIRLLVFSLASLAIAGCAPSAITEEEVVPVYESPCDVYEPGVDACGAAGANGSYVEAWSALPCMDVCSALNKSEPHPLLACGPVHPAIDGENAGFVVVTCTFDGESYQ